MVIIWIKKIPIILLYPQTLKNPTKKYINLQIPFLKHRKNLEQAYMVEFFDKNNQIVEELSTEFITTDPVYRYADKVLKNDKNEIITVEYQNSKPKGEYLYCIHTL